MTCRFISRFNGTLFTCGEAVRSMTYNSPSPPPSPSPSPRINKIGQVRASKEMVTYVIEVTDLKYEVRGCSDLKAAKKGQYRISNMHMDK